MTTELKMPELLDPSPTHYRERGMLLERMEMYTAEQMREYALAAIASAAPHSAQTVAQEREAFEKSYAERNDGFVPPFFDGEYDFADAQPCWLTWQARAALALSDEHIVSAVHDAGATGRISLTHMNNDGVEVPTYVAKHFVRLLSAAQGKESE